MTATSARDGYRLWAPHYSTETVVSALEDEVVRALGVQTHGERLLDVGCGTGRRLQAAGGAMAVGVDLTAEMLRASDASFLSVVASADELPIASAAFTIVWCRLMIGHVANGRAVYAELSRVCARGGAVIVSDVSVAATLEGHRRTFRASDGVLHTLEHHIHTVDAQAAWAREHGMTLVERRTGRIGESVRALYEDAGAIEKFHAQREQPLVDVLHFRRE